MKSNIISIWQHNFISYFIFLYYFNLIVFVSEDFSFVQMFLKRCNNINKKDTLILKFSYFQRITINDHKEIEVVSSAKLLGVVVSDNLRWNAHVESICKKAATRLYFLKQLKRAKVPPNDMLLFYTCIRPVLEYACPVFHHSLLQYLSNEMERLQKRALRIILSDLFYAEALVALDITSLYERREALSNALFDQIVRDQSHKLHDLLPPRNGSTYCTRSQRYFKLPICKTNRFKNTFIMANSFNY